VSIFATIISGVAVFAGRVKDDVSTAFQQTPKLDYSLASLYIERTGKVVDYSVWFSHDALEALDQNPDKQETRFVDDMAIRELMDGKWVRRTCESKQHAVRFHRHLSDSCYPSLLSLLSSICK
jgi:hypothetical protein